MIFELDKQKGSSEILSEIERLTVSLPADIKEAEIIPAEALRQLRERRDQWIQSVDGLVVNSEESLEACGEAIDTCIASKRAVSGKLSGLKAFFHGWHKKFTGLESDLNGPIEVIEAALRKRAATYRQAMEEAAAKAAAEAQRRAEQEARAAKEAAEKAAREAAEKAAQEAEQARLNAAAAAAAGDLDAEMEAEAEAQAAAKTAAKAALDAAAVSLEPVRPVYAPVAEPPIKPGSGGGTLQYKYVAVCADTDASRDLQEKGLLQEAEAARTVNTIRCIARAITENPDRMDLVRLLCLDQSAANDIAASLKTEARIPGMEIVKKPVERRTPARRK